MRTAWAITAFVALGCGPDGGQATDGGTHADGGGDGFDDHTRAALGSRADYAALLAPGPGLESVKFIVTDFADANARDSRFYDGNFFTLHDEWYWFRLLNGQRVPGDPETAPVRGFRFDSIALIYAWARTQGTLPLDLAFTGDGRMYSGRFYALALDTAPRRYGLGSLLHVPAKDARPERWAFELEYTDDVTHDELVVYFEALQRELPADIAGALTWVVRSPVQEALAVTMEAQQLRFHDKIVRYKDITVPGEKEVYSEGITAGRVRVVRAGEALEGGAPSDLLVLEAAPDYLPPASALITAVPQTPLAHVNVLARNRGIPNAYLGAAVDDPVLDQLGRVRAPALVYAAAPGTLEVVALSEDEYRQYLDKTVKTPSAVSPVDVSRVEYVYDLESLSPDESDDWRPIIGGKNTGYLEVLHTPGVSHPDRPLGLSIRAYVEHLAPLRPRIEQLIRHPEVLSEERTRYAVLEGEGDYRQRYTRPADVTYLNGLLTRHPAGSLLGDMVRGGGLRGVIRGTPMSAGALDAITRAITQQFGDYAVSQGLRFRSSSNVEDIEGFNGAGLYDSNTGFIDAQAQVDPDDRKQTLEWAIKKTWASYWSFEGYEERRLELIDHLSGSMGVTVHARFDDDKEVSNGVITFTVLPPIPVEGEGAARTALLVMEVNAQHGAVSVTNPDPLDPQLPEVDQVVIDLGPSAPRVVRVQQSTLRNGAPVLSDAELLSLFEQTRAISERWLARVQRDSVTPAQAPRTLTLDFEYRAVAAGWPALASGRIEPARLIIKQARTLEPGLRRVEPAIASVPLPRDVLVRARRITRTTCNADRLSLVVWDALTDPLSAPDLGHSTLPFVASVSVIARADLPELGLTANSTATLTHLDYEARHTGGGLVVTTSSGAIARVEVGPDRHYRVVGAAQEITGEATVCREVVMHATAKEYLFQLLEASR